MNLGIQMCKLLKISLCRLKKNPSLRYRMANDGEHEFFAERVTVPNGQTAFIFINDEALEDFVNATSVHSDATFKSPPRLFYQMGTLHAFVHGVVSFNAC